MFHSPRLRPTSYQPPLVQCHSDPGYHVVTNEVLPVEAMAVISAMAGKAASTASAKISLVVAVAGLALSGNFCRY